MTITLHHQRTEAYQQGERAFELGLPKVCNPYDRRGNFIEIQKHDFWQFGWEKARDTKMSKAKEAKARTRTEDEKFEDLINSAAFVRAVRYLTEDK